MLADAKKNSGNESSATLLEVKGLRIEGLSEKGWQKRVGQYSPSGVCFLKREERGDGR